MIRNAQTGYYEATILGQPPNTYVKFIIMAYDVAENLAVRDDIDPYYVGPIIPEFSFGAMLLLLIVTCISFATICKRKRVPNNLPQNKAKYAPFTSEN
ncbi:MAG: hypothetical protein ACUVUF_00695 [Candidatus Bathycorpusculaceae bacterium]